MMNNQQPKVGSKRKLNDIKLQDLAEQLEELKESNQNLTKELEALKKKVQRRVLSEHLKSRGVVGKASSATSETVENWWLPGSLAAHWRFIEAVENMYDSKNVNQDHRSAELANLISQVYPSAPYYMLKKLKYEEVCTSAMSSLLKDPFFFGTDVEWYHQFEKVDVLGIRKELSESDHYPQIFMEFKLPSSSDNKECQLLTYINNFVEKSLFADNKWKMCLGVIVELHSRTSGGHFILKGYYEVHDYDDMRKKLAVVDIYRGDWNVQNIQRLLVTFRSFMNFGNVEKPPSFDKDWLTRNIYFNRENTLVYKIFDGRNKFIMRRNYMHNIKFLPNCKIYFQSTEDLTTKGFLTIIQYEYIEGTHIASHSRQIKVLLKKLKNFHDNNYVHGDIRASNIVFTKKSAFFIDFDYMSHNSDCRYPNGFNMNIVDGKRHPDIMVDGEMRTEHDCYSMAAVLKMFKPKDDEFTDAWKTIRKRVKRGKLDRAIEKLSETPRFFIEQQTQFQVRGGTGVSPQKKHEFK